MAESQLEMLLDLPEPFGPDDLVEKYTVYVALPNVDFIDRVVALKNGLAERAAAEADVEVRRRWTRKKLTEALVKVQVDALKAQLAPMLKEVGELPKHDDGKALDKYIERLVDWSKKKF